MPVIDVYAASGTFARKRELIAAVTAAVMKWEAVPPIALFKDNASGELQPIRSG